VRRDRVHDGVHVLPAPHVAAARPAERI
jgi:hypothetical protein